MSPGGNQISSQVGGEGDNVVFQKESFRGPLELQPVRNSPVGFVEADGFLRVAPFSRGVTLLLLLALLGNTV